VNLYPFDEVAKNAESKIADGWTVHQQFNCVGCGAKQTMEDENVFHAKGRCEECGHVTDIRKDGCNFMMTKGARGR
jgi:hypothetical protein